MTGVRMTGHHSKKMTIPNLDWPDIIQKKKKKHPKRGSVEKHVEKTREKVHFSSRIMVCYACPLFIAFSVLSIQVVILSFGPQLYNIYI